MTIKEAVNLLIEQFCPDSPVGEAISTLVNEIDRLNKIIDMPDLPDEEEVRKLRGKG